MTARPKVILIPAFLAFAFICWFLLRPPNSPAENHLRQGLEALEKCQYSEAEQHFRAQLRAEPWQPSATEMLAVMLLESGRTNEAGPFVREALKRSPESRRSLLIFTAESHVQLDEAVLEKWRKKSPDDTAPLIGLSRIAFSQGKIDIARQLAEQILSRNPDELEAHVVLGQTLLVTAPERLADWDRNLPSRAVRHSGVWFVRGEWAQMAGRPKEAIRCFAQGLRISPGDRSANLRLGQLADPALAAVFLKRVETLRAIADLLMVVQRKLDSPKVWDLAKQLSSMGRRREASLWLRIAMMSAPAALEQVNADPDLANLMTTTPGTEPTQRDHNPADSIRLEDYPEWRSIELTDVTKSRPSRAGIRFSDQAEALNLNFTYFNGDDPNTEGKRMQEWTGGGVAILDADSDGWPDLYFSQGCPWPPGQDAHMQDQLFRNRNGQTFRNVTAAAGLGDSEFSQGVIVADFDNDGFDDLFVGNIGPNRLYLGNGDGSFRDVTQQAGIVGNAWTSSCAAADFNGDGVTDLFVANYLQGEMVHEAICRNREVAVVCAPTSFEAGDDQLLINLGDGRFSDQTETSGILVPRGMGLGVVAANLTDDTSIDIFVANDQQPNFCFVNETPTSGESIRFTEQAVSTGLAYDRDGKAQACRGIAIGDLNADERPDLFVTNFANESNTLYLSRPAGTLEDVTLTTGLTEPSFAMLGFGTAFFDADLDGHFDLVVANGHIGDHRAFGQLYRMPTQMFSNTGTASIPEFAEVPAPEAGPYFEKAVLGRGLALLDWNRDGRPDFAVSHLDTPAALLTNDSDAGRFLDVRLCGVVSARDAVGTHIKLLAEDRQWTFQLSSGGSFQSSSQRHLLCGLGTAERVDTMIVSWPSGQVQTFSNILTNQVLTIIEGRQPFRLD